MPECNGLLCWFPEDRKAWVWMAGALSPLFYLLPNRAGPTVLKGTASCHNNPHTMVAWSVWRSTEYYFSYMPTTASACSLYYKGLLETLSIPVQKRFAFYLRLQWCQHRVCPPKCTQPSSLPNTLGVWRTNKEMVSMLTAWILAKIKREL